MALSFPRSSFTVAGKRAKVVVRCTGTTGARCAGTLRLRLRGETHRTRFSLPRGKRRTLSIWLGDSLALLEGPNPPRALAIAHTRQPAGGKQRTSRRLGLK